MINWKECEARMSKTNHGTLHTLTYKEGSNNKEETSRHLRFWQRFKLNNFWTEI